MTTVRMPVDSTNQEIEPSVARAAIQAHHIEVERDVRCRVAFRLAVKSPPFSPALPRIGSPSHACCASSLLIERPNDVGILHSWRPRWLSVPTKREDRSRPRILPMSSLFEEIRAYVDFGPADEAALRRLAPELPRVSAELVEDFYRVILEHPEARAVFADTAQIERLKQSLRDWLARLLNGPFDAEWFERGTRIGRRHVEVGLAQRFMPLAMNRLRRGLVELALTTEWDDPADVRAIVAAVEKAVDVELTMMLESYAEMHQGRVRQSERLAALGQLAASVGQELKNPLGVINTSVLL